MKGTYTNNKAVTLTFETIKKAIALIEQGNVGDIYLKGVSCNSVGFEELTEFAVDERKAISKPGLLFTSYGIDLFVNRQQEEKFIPIWGDREKEKMGPFANQKPEIRKEKNESTNSLKKTSQPS